MVKEIQSQEEFDSALKDAGDCLVVVDFHATWCGPCKMIAPKIEAMSKESFPNCVFLKVDVDELEDIAGSYDVSAMPTFVLIRNGKTVEKVIGANEKKIKDTISKHA